MITLLKNTRSSTAYHIIFLFLLRQIAHVNFVFYNFVKQINLRTLKYFSFLKFVLKNNLRKKINYLFFYNVKNLVVTTSIFKKKKLAIKTKDKILKTKQSSAKRIVPIIRKDYGGRLKKSFMKISYGIYKEKKTMGLRRTSSKKNRKFLILSNKLLKSRRRWTRRKKKSLGNKIFFLRKNFLKIKIFLKKYMYIRSKKWGYIPSKRTRASYIKFCVKRSNIFRYKYKYTMAKTASYYRKNFFLKKHLSFIKFVASNGSTRWHASELKKFSFLRNLNLISPLFSNKFIIKRFLTSKFKWVWRTLLRSVFSIRHAVASLVPKYSNFNFKFFTDINKKNFQAKKFSNKIKDNISKNFMGTFWLCNMQKILNTNVLITLKKKYIVRTRIWCDFMFYRRVRSLRTPYRYKNLNLLTTKILLIAAKFISPFIIITWIKNLITTKTIWRHPTILAYVTSALNLMFKYFYGDSIAGLYISIRGKIGKTGSVRKKKYIYTRGQVSRTNILIGSNFASSAILTKSGVLGISVGVFYE
jgi:hypothetical protein